MVSSITTFWLLASFFGAVLAHPGHDDTAEVKMRRSYMASLKNRGLEHCTVKLKQSRVEDHIIARRQAMVKEVRMARGLEHHEGMLMKRDWDKAINSSHLSNHTFHLETPDWMIFGDKAAILNPEVTEGPYYVEGEKIRKDVRDKEPGVDVYLDIQMIDMNTCEPVKNIAVDFWHCNATGVYGGIAPSADGFMPNGNSLDKTIIDNPMLRGIQISDKNGALQFISKFPGHYNGRTNHIHVLSHANFSVVESNKTLSGGSVAHVGQLFFDQALVDEVEKVAPYSSNKEEITKNVEDEVMWDGAQGEADPVVEYVLLGKKIEDGIFAWANMGIDSTATHAARAATKCDADGCHSNPKPLCISADMLNANKQGKKGKFPGSKKGKGKKGKGIPKGMPPMCGPDGKPPPPGTPQVFPDWEGPLL